MDMLSTEWQASEIRAPSKLSRLWTRLRSLWAVRATRAAIRDLTKEQLRDIGLSPSDAEMELNEHYRYWRRHLVRW